MSLDELKFNERVDHKNLIIRLQAFGRLRAALSLLGLISQTQPKRYSHQPIKGLEYFNMKQPFVDIHH